MVKHQERALDATFAALSDPTRRAILARLTEGERSMSELAQPFNMTLPAVLKHVRVLEGAGLVRQQKTGRTVWCRLEAAPLQAAGDWISRYAAFWQARLDALDRFLKETDPKGR